MRILLDVDGTIARNNRVLYLTLCNLVLKLGIDEERLSEMSYEEFYLLPEVTAYREREGEQRYLRNVRIIAHAPELQRRMEVIEGAIDGAWMLSRQGTLGYCTARKTDRLEKLDKALARSTHDWLESNGFPNPQDVFFCTSFLEKLSFCAAHIEETGEDVMLVDDSYEQLLSKVDQLEASQRDLLRQHFTLLAFGAQDVPEHAPVRVVALPTWKQVEQAIQHIGKEGREAYALA
jgi:hypothetical protein